ncbi:RNA-binding protein [Maricaulaceae bacterium NA33B04]|nr:RNA-binding protein [Maricaulaceae bacterium NA33B04]
MSRGARTSRDKPVRERRCVATGETAGPDRLLRVALSPDGVVTPDIAARLPGRGAWVTADRALIDKAVNKRLFNRAFEKPVEAPKGLADQFETLLEARALSMLGLARRAGRLAMGYDTVKLALSKGDTPAWRIEASDGAADGRGKLDRISAAAWPHLATVGCFSAEAIGQALGRSGVVHALLTVGPEADGFGAVVSKLAGFRVINPFDTQADKGAQDG